MKPIIKGTSLVIMIMIFSIPIILNSLPATSREYQNNQLSVKNQLLFGNNPFYSEYSSTNNEVTTKSLSNDYYEGINNYQ